LSFGRYPFLSLKHTRIRVGELRAFIIDISILKNTIIKTANACPLKKYLDYWMDNYVSTL